MFENMFEAKRDEETGLYHVRPVGPGQAEYVVVFSSAQEAKMFCAQITMGQVPTPTQAPSSYREEGFLKDGVTRIYHLK